MNALEVAITVSEPSTCKSADFDSALSAFKDTRAPKALEVAITASEASTCKSDDSGSYSLTFRSGSVIM